MLYVMKGGYICILPIILSLISLLLVLLIALLS